MNTITERNVEVAFRRYVKACHRLGLVPEGASIGLEYGSKTKGQCFKVYTIKPHSGQDRPPAGPMHIGMTKREASDILTERASALEDVARAMGK